MEATTSPADSVPSLAEVSRASTEGDEVARVLFGTPEIGEEADYQEEDSTTAGKAVSFESDVSIASEGLNTVVDAAYSQIGGYSSTEKPRAAYHGECSLSLEDAETMDDVPIQPSCHGGLNLSPSQLAGIFNVFDASQRNWPSVYSYESYGVKSPSSTAADSMTDAVTTLTSNVDPYSTVGWERKVDSLERELKTLKDIIKTDSDQRLKLQAEIETLRSTKTETSSGTGVPGGSVDALMQERDDLRERDSQHLETIKILTEELNTLAKTSQSSRELDQLRLENELFASQIVENENEMQELRSTLKILEEENKRLIDEIANVQTTESTQGINTGREHSSGNPWKDQLESLAARVADIECDRDRRNQSLEAERRKVHAELESIRAIALARNPTADRFVRGDVGGHQSNKSEELINDVEVTLEGKILTSATSLLECPNNDKNQAQEKMERNKSWGGFCDCFLSANQEEEP